MRGIYKKIFTVLLAVSIIMTTKAYALTITHPSRQNITVTEKGIFFTGKISDSETVYINGVKINPETNGAFCHCFSLKIGDNIFEIKKEDGENFETKKYTVKRVSPSTANTHNKFIPKEPEYYLTSKDGTILRNTPVNAGMNRLGYLPEDTEVFVDGKYNEFSRVYLKNGKYGWIMTCELKPEICINSEYHPVKFINKEEQILNDKTVYSYNLEKNTPYSAVSNGEKLTLTIFNLDNDEECYTEEFLLDKIPRYSVDLKNNLLTLSIKNDFQIKKTTKKHTKQHIPQNISKFVPNIVIDAGHGGNELGAVGCLGDKEKDLNLKVALCLKEVLESHNYNVYLTRTDDSFMSLTDRVAYGKENNATIFISIHLNSVPISVNPNLHSGTIVYYYNPQAKKFAEILSKTVTEGIQTKNNGIAQSSLAVIRPTEYIGVLIELAFMVNPKDVDIYKSEDFAQNSAEAIYKGIEDYFNNELKN